MAVSDSTLSVDIWNEVKSILVATAPYVSNSSTSATTAASINAAFNDRSGAKPQVVVYPITDSEDTWKFGSYEGRKMINVLVECYAQNSLGTDQLIDQVKSALKNNVIDGIELVGVTTDRAFNLANDSKWHMKSGSFTYDRE